jgi:hypothetical protein
VWAYVCVQKNVCFTSVLVYIALSLSLSLSLSLFFFFFKGKVFTDKPRLIHTAPGKHTGVAGR